MAAFRQPSKGRFATRLVIEKIGPTRYRLREPLAYRRANGDVVTVPAGTETDGATVPPILRPFMTPFGRAAEAAVLHDYTGDHELFHEALQASDYSPALAWWGRWAVTAHDILT